MAGVEAKLQGEEALTAWRKANPGQTICVWAAMDRGVCTAVMQADNGWLNAVGFQFAEGKFKYLCCETGKRGHWNSTRAHQAMARLAKRIGKAMKARS